MRAKNQAITIREVDWRSFEKYLEAIGLSPRRRYDLVMYARRYYWLLRASRSEALRALASVSPHVAVKVLAALRRLSEFLEAEDDWLPKARWLRRRLRRRLEEALPGTGLPKYLRVGAGFVESLLGVASLLPGQYRLFAVFLLSTGLRVSHALHAWRHYSELLVERWGIPHLVLNIDGGKRAWIALLTPELYDQLPRRARLGMSYTRLRRHWRHACTRLGIDHRVYKLYDLRTAHATLLLEKGAPAWYIDMLQGRTNAKILMQHYNAAEMRKLYNQWFLPALREPVRKLLENP